MNFFKGIALSFKGGYLGVFIFFDGIKDSAVQIIMILLCIIFVVCIFLVIFLVIRNLQKKQMQNAIYPTMLAVLISCMLMFPLTLSFNKLIKIQIRKGYVDDLSKTQIELKNNNLEKEKLKAEKEKIKLERQLEEEKAKKDIEVNKLQKQINLLQASQVSAMNFHDILKLGLITVEFNTKQVWNDGLSPLKKAHKHNPINIGAMKYDFYQEEYLIVNTYDMDATFGIDFNKIKIKKINDNKIQVCGIKAEYLGSVKNIKNNEIAEIRECRYVENQDEPVDVIVKKDKNSIIRAGERERENDKKYQDALRNMDNWKPFEKPVISLGKNFIKMIFAPVYSEIEFVEEDDGTFVNMKDYINTEISQYNKQIEETLKPVKIDIVQQEKPNNIEN